MPLISLLLLSLWIILLSVKMQTLAWNGEGSGFGKVNGKGAFAFHSTSVIFATGIVLLLKLKTTREEIGMAGAKKKRIYN